MEDLLPCSLCHKSPFISAARGNSRTVCCFNKGCHHNSVTSLLTWVARLWNERQTELAVTGNVIALDAFKHIIPVGWIIDQLAEDDDKGWACRLKGDANAIIECSGLSPHEAVANAVHDVTALI